LSVDGEEDDLGLQVKHLPHSLTHFSLYHLSDPPPFFPSISAPEDWPPGLTSLQLHTYGQAPPLPSNLRVLDVDACCSLGAGPLPDSLTTLRAICPTAAPVLVHPSRLTTLEMRLSDKYIALLPASLTHLTLYGVEGSFTSDECLQLPSGLRYLCLLSVPFRPFRNLPPSLEHLIVKEVFRIRYEEELWDQPISHDSLQTLILPAGFDQKIDAKLLPNLRVLSLKQGFDQPLDDLPVSLTDLTLNLTLWSHCSCLDLLPRSIRKLTLGLYIRRPLDGLPDDLEELCLKLSPLTHPLDRLPRNLRALTLSEQFDQPLDVLPHTLTRLDLSLASLFDRPLGQLPDSLQVLLLPSSFKQPFDRLPSSLRVLRFAYNSAFDHPLDHLPDSLSTLRLGNLFQQPFRRLPRGLTSLTFGDAFNHPLPLVKPDHESSADVTDSKTSTDVPVSYPMALRSFELGRNYNQPLSLPPSLTKLSFDEWGKFRQPLPLSSIPAKMTYLLLPRAYRDEYPEWNDMEAVRERCPFLCIDDGTGDPEGY